MSDSIHGHEVLNMMLASGKQYTRESLEADVAAKFGAAARFHTCSAENLTAAELVEFLERRGKFTGGEAGFNTTASQICSH